MSQNPLPQARITGLVTQELPDEVLVYDLKTHKAHCLNHTAAIVWKYCDGKNSVPEMASLISRETQPPIDEATVWQALERLGKANLLEERVTLPAGVPRLGRREAMRRIGLGSAMAVPVVMSILAPSAMAGCTFPDSQGLDSSCCTSSQCDASLHLTCCPVTGTCKGDTNFACSPDGANSNCCSGQCSGGTCT